MKFVITQKQYKKLINENEHSLLKSNRFVDMFIKYISNLSQGIKPEMDDLDEYDIVQFVNEKGKLLFRYNYEQKRLMYDIENVMKPIYMAVTDGVTTHEYRLLDDIIKTWAEENLVPKFNEYIKEQFGGPFEIYDCHSDEEYYEWKNEQDEYED